MKARLRSTAARRLAQNAPQEHFAGLRRRSLGYGSRLHCYATPAAPLQSLAQLEISFLLQTVRDSTSPQVQYAGTSFPGDSYDCRPAQNETGTFREEVYL